MIVVAMNQFQELLMLCSSQEDADRANLPGQPKKLPLIKVVASMNAPNIVVSPNIQDIYKFLSKLLKNIPESAKNFVRYLI